MDRRRDIQADTRRDTKSDARRDAPTTADDRRPTPVECPRWLDRTARALPFSPLFVAGMWSRVLPGVRR